MAFLDFLKKKPAVSTSAQSAPASMQPAPTAPDMHSDAHLDLPELPSFDAPANMGSANELPALPSFDEHSSMNAPANFSIPEMPSFDDVKASSASKNASQPQAMAPPSFSHSEPTMDAQESDDSNAMPAVDARTPYGPVFCDVETYRAILDNMSHAKDEVIQLQSFAENGLKLQQKTQTQYDEFHNTLSNMAKKLLLAEAKLFK